MEFTLRPGTRDDLATLVAFNRAMCVETEHRELDEDTVTAGVTACFDQPDLGFYLVAEAGSRVIGSLMITTEWSDWRNGLFWWIQSVYIEPDARRQGVFAALYDEVGRLGRQDPAVCGVRLYVEKENVTAQQTYTSLGMSETDYRLFEIEY